MLLSAQTPQSSVLGDAAQLWPRLSTGWCCERLSNTGVGLGKAAADYWGLFGGLM